MGIFNNLFKNNYHRVPTHFDEDIDLPEANENTFIIHDIFDYTRIFVNKGDSFDLTTVNRFGHIVNRNMVYKSTITGYYMTDFYEKPKTFSLKPGRLFYDVVIESNGEKVMEILDMDNVTANNLYSFIEHHLRV